MGVSSCGDAAITDNSDKTPTAAVAQLLQGQPNPSCRSSATAADRKAFLDDHPELTDKQLARVCPDLFPDGYLKPADRAEQDAAARKALQGN
jgi:hypothetical protein